MFNVYLPIIVSMAAGPVTPPGELHDRAVGEHLPLAVQILHMIRKDHIDRHVSHSAAGSGFRDLENNISISK